MTFDARGLRTITAKRTAAMVSAMPMDSNSCFKIYSFHQKNLTGSGF
jgi:hypothetical protein